MDTLTLKPNRLSSVLILFLFIFMFIVAGTATAQEEKTGDSAGKKEKSKQIVDLFTSDEPMEVILKYDLSAYMKKSAENAPVAADMAFIINGDTINNDIIITHRGFFRLHYCIFPPIEVKFKKPIYAYRDTTKIKKLKLVTHCANGSIYDEYVLREFLVYKLYNALTDSSYRVRLLKITYYDTRKNKKPSEYYGYFIEPKNMMATRLNAVPIKAPTLNQSHIEPTVMDRVAIFNYMIGNWDWAVQSQHNIHVIKSLAYNPTGLGIAIPFDFDLVGVVNVDYNAPPPESGLQTNRDRIFKGMCRDREVYRTAVLKIAEKKDKLYDIVNNFPYLSKRSKVDIINYLDEFFDPIERSFSFDNMLNIFTNSCSAK
jgi:hypothetical protein